MTLCWVTDLSLSSALMLQTNHVEMFTCQIITCSYYQMRLFSVQADLTSIWPSYGAFSGDFVSLTAHEYLVRYCFEADSRRTTWLSVKKQNLFLLCCLNVSLSDREKLKPAFQIPWRTCCRSIPICIQQSERLSQVSLSLFDLSGDNKLDTDII